MLDLGFDPEAIGSFGGTVLHGAAWEGCVECVEAVLRHARGRDLIEQRDATHGGTPLGWCCHGASHCGNPRGNYPRVAQLLLDVGARTIPDPEQVRADVAAVLRGWR
jgi:hypothetical protein